MEDIVVNAFSAALGRPDAVVDDIATLTAEGHDYWGVGGIPGLVVRPTTTAEIVEVLRIAAEHKIHVVTRGGGSNCAGAMMPSPERVLLDLSKMNRVLDIDPTARTARVQPGVINAALQHELASHGLCFSPDPVSANLATVGGNIVENAGGPHALKYGVTYNHVLSVEAVLADGTIIQLTAADDGPDLLGVLIGSEGTLGIVVEATVALRPIPPVTRSLMGSFTNATDAAETVAAVIDTGTVPAALEWLDRAGIAGLEQFTDTGYPTDVDAILLIDVDGSLEEVDRDTEIVEEVLRRKAVEVRRADDEESRAKLWYGRLHASDNVVAMGKGFFIGDVTVPRNRIPDMQEAIQAAAARHADGLLFIAVAGHAGDGDLHPITFFDRDNPRASAALEAANNEIVDAALSLGGTITGEHGVGTEKRQFMTKRFTPVEIAAQRSIKRAFDPIGLLNPGVMLPDVSPDEPNLDFFEAALNTALRKTQAATAGPPATVAGQTQIAINTANLSLVVGAAVTLDELSRCLTDHGVNCPAIPAAATQRTVSDLIANASGDERNAVRHNLLGLEVVLRDGRHAARFGGENMKDVAGYDTKRLFVGSRNTFGTITTAIFKISVDAAHRRPTPLQQTPKESVK
jgi:glycolate oxidase